MIDGSTMTKFCVYSLNNISHICNMLAYKTEPNVGNLSLSK